jgi:hypothetical protein
MMFVETGDGGLKIGTKWMRGGWLLIVGLLLGLAHPALAAGPVETSIFAVSGVEADITSTDAAAAKNQALLDVQVKAFFMLAERLGSAELAADLSKSMKPEDITPFLKSLSIEEETSAPGRYIGKFTVRFLPSKITEFYERYGIRLPSHQAKPILVLPVWRGKEGNQLWEDTAWRKTWLNLRAEQGIVPLIVPLGDLEDSEAIDAEAALLGDPIKIEAIKRRYGTESVLIAQAQDAEGGVHLYIEGETDFGNVKYNKVFTSEDGTFENAAKTGVETFNNLLIKAYSKYQAQTAADSSSTRQSLDVAVPFSSPSEWNRIRSRILATPNVHAVDVSSLSFEGAVIRLVYSRSLELLQENMLRTGLNLGQYGQTWVIQQL